MITVEQKDALLSLLVESEVSRGEFDLRELASELGIDKDILKTIIRGFEKLELLELFPSVGATVSYSLLLNAHDVYRRGGFRAEELLLKESFEKLQLELESLKKTAPSKVATITAIINNITAAIALFK